METKQILVKLPIHEKLKRVAFENKTTILDVVDDILNKELDNWKPNT